MSLRSLILIFNRFARKIRGALGCRPNPPEGDSPSDSLLRFAAADVVLRLKHIFQRKPVSIAECFAFCSETTFFIKGDTLGALPQTPAGNKVPCTLSSLRGGFKRLIPLLSHAIAES